MSAYFKDMSGKDVLIHLLSLALSKVIANIAQSLAVMLALLALRLPVFSTTFFLLWVDKCNTAVLEITHLPQKQTAP